MIFYLHVFKHKTLTESAQVEGPAVCIFFAYIVLHMFPGHSVVATLYTVKASSIMRRIRSSITDICIERTQWMTN